MKSLLISLAILIIGLIFVSGCSSQDDAAAGKESAIVTVEQLDVVMLRNESGGDCFVAGLYHITNIGESPVVDEKVSVDLMDVLTGEKLDSMNISVGYLPSGSSGNYTVRFDHLECLEKYGLVAPLQKGFFRK